MESSQLAIGGMIKFKFEKKDDKTLIIHRPISDETFTVVAIP